MSKTVPNQAQLIAELEILNQRVADLKLRAPVQRTESSCVRARTLPAYHPGR